VIKIETGIFKPGSNGDYHRIDPTEIESRGHGVKNKSRRQIIGSCQSSADRVHWNKIHYGQQAEHDRDYGPGAIRVVKEIEEEVLKTLSVDTETFNIIRGLV
jgi:hypothetical protein